MLANKVHVDGHYEATRTPGASLGNGHQEVCLTIG
jgi:hypothetical protein